MHVGLIKDVTVVALSFPRNNEQLGQRGFIICVTVPQFS